MSDLDIHLAAIRRGEQHAFAAWMVGAEPVLRASLRGFATQVDVEVVVQEALIRAWQYAQRVEEDGGGNSLLRYARRVARNLAIDETRRWSREQRREEPPEEVTTPEPPDPAMRRWIRTCLDALPARPQAAMRARLEASGRRHDRELAATVEMSLNTFLKNVGRARTLLQTCLKSHGVEAT